MALPKRRHTSSRQGMRRAHIGLTTPALSVCPQCGKPKLAHRICLHCGYYKGSKIIETRKEKKEKKKKKKKKPAQ